jgi:hypothetical protein
MEEALASSNMSPYVAASRPVRPVRVLLATTGRLPSTARMAMELHHAGAQVSLVSPSSHPARVLDFLTDQLPYRAAAPTWSLEAALKRLRPDVVIPCDERTVRDLHAICRRTRDVELRNLIETSTAPMRHYATITSRAALLALAAREGVRVPPSAGLQQRSDLAQWMQTQPTPFVLKADGSWSGFGVRIISDSERAEDAYDDLTRPIGLRLALREAVLESNYFGFRPWLRREQPAMSAQGFVDGWPANIGVACWNGEVLASICVEAVATESATGPSTVARVIDNAEMVEAARRVVKALGLSGMIGFDFMIEAATGAAYMIEMNPRNTPICALRLGNGRDLPEALLARVAGRSQRERPPRTERDIIAFFPETWAMNPSNSFLHQGFHDVPWEQPELVRVLIRPERRERYLIFRLLRRAWLARQGKPDEND